MNKEYYKQYYLNNPDKYSNFNKQKPERLSKEQLRLNKNACAKRYREANKELINAKQNSKNAGKKTRITYTKEEMRERNRIKNKNTYRNKNPNYWKNRFKKVLKELNKKNKKQIKRQKKILKKEIDINSPDAHKNRWLEYLARHPELIN